MRPSPLIATANNSSWLKLPKDTTVPFFYADVEDGGLGLTHLRFRIPPLRANRLRNMAVSNDPVVKAIVRSSRFRKELSKWSKQSMFKELNMSTRELRRSGFKHYLHASVDGAGLVHHPLVPTVHAWIDDGSSRMTGRKFIAAVALRANTLPTRSARGVEVLKPIDRTNVLLVDRQLLKVFRTSYRVVSEPMVVGSRGMTESYRF